MADLNTQGLPMQVSRTRFDFDGQVIEVVVDWRRVLRLTREALASKSGQAKAGPVTVKVVR